MSLCSSNCMVFAAFLIVHTLCNQLLLEPSVNPLILCKYVTDILKMCKKKFYDEKIIFDTFAAFLT